MRLGDIKPAKGSVKNAKRKARGWGSGNGKTAGRGYNGQGQRSGGGVRPGFEGGQMPLFRRLPKKKYFTVINQVNYGIVNVSALSKYAEGTKVDMELLRQDGVIDKHSEALRVLGNGEISVKLTVEAHHFTAGAKEKLEAAGCTCVNLSDESAE